MKVEFVFGIGYDSKGKQINPLYAAIAGAKIGEKAARMFGGCNIITGHGVWESPGGDTISEPSITIVAESSGSAEEHEKQIAELAQFISEKLNQKAVHVTTYRATSKDVFIHREEAVTK